MMTTLAFSELKMIDRVMNNDLNVLKFHNKDN